MGMPRSLLALLLTAVFLAAIGFAGAPMVLAGDAAAVADTPVPVHAGSEGGEDPFHVSDKTLTVAVVLPLIFLVLTGATIAWAWSNRRRDGDDLEEDED